MVTLYVDGTYLTSTGASTFGRITVVDLAGSERLKETRSRNVKESGFINKSLYTLGKVINGISKNGGTLLPGTTRRHIPNIPFRESVLTKLLVQSLGGENMCSMCACVSSGANAMDEVRDHRPSNPVLFLFANPLRGGGASRPSGRCRSP